MSKKTEKETGLTLETFKVGDRYIAVLSKDGNIINKMGCSLKCDIGCICREMLRWYSKLGGVSKWASSARKRHVWNPKGITWNWHKLEDELKA